MARLTRATQKVFAGSATNNGVFGSLQAGSGQLSNDVETIQSLPAYEEGWNAATTSSELLPPLEEFQGLQYVNSYQQAYMFQEGIPEWDSETTYYQGSWAKGTNSSGDYVIYESVSNNNTGNQPSTDDRTNWVEKSLGGGGMPIGTIGYTLRTDVPENCAWCDGSEYTQAQFPDLYQMLVEGKLQSLSYAEYTNRISSDGYCEFIGFDSLTTSFKVPTIPDSVVIGLNDSTPVIGTGIGIQLTDGTNSYTLGGVQDKDYSNGSLYRGGLGFTDENTNELPQTSGGWIGGNSFNKVAGLATDNSGIIADTSNLAKTLTLKYYVVLYTGAVEASVAQAQEFINALGGKANTDLSNINTTAKNTIAGLGMPSGEYIDLDFTTATQSMQTAVANGYLSAYDTSAGSNQFASINVYDENENQIYTNAVNSGAYTASSRWYIPLSPIKKGQKYQLSSNMTYGDKSLKFIYAEGSQN